jgi:voltage-gated potassium channel
MLSVTVALDTRRAAAGGAEYRSVQAPDMQPIQVPGQDGKVESQPADPQEHPYGKPDAPWRRKVYHIIFESDTPEGRLFDVVLICAILLSVLAVILDSVPPIASRYGRILNFVEWFFTFLFTIEYLARLAAIRNQVRYARSFFGVIDLLSVLPTYLALFFPPAHSLLDVRILRLLRIFRILKLTNYVLEYSMLGRALLASRRKIFIFISFVMLVVVLLGTCMYVVEGEKNGFTSIPTSIYWAISTITTVGFGDIVPKTDIGRAIASLIMLLGWGILAVPTGIISSEMTAQRFVDRSVTRRCASCGVADHETGARFCKDCGAPMTEQQG